MLALSTWNKTDNPNTLRAKHLQAFKSWLRVSIDTDWVSTSKMACKAFNAGQTSFFENTCTNYDFVVDCNLSSLKMFATRIATLLLHSSTEFIQSTFMACSSSISSGSLTRNVSWATSLALNIKHDRIKLWPRPFPLQNASFTWWFRAKILPW